MDVQSFRQFNAGRPALNLTALAEESGVEGVNLFRIVVGLRKIPQAKRGYFLSVAQKYGYRPSI